MVLFFDRKDKENISRIEEGYEENEMQEEGLGKIKELWIECDKEERCWFLRSLRV